MKLGNTITIKSNNTTFYPNKFLRILLYVYIFLSFYEAYLNILLGSYLKYFILTVIPIFLLSYKKIKITKVIYSFIFWFLFKILSIVWGLNSPYQSSDFFNHFLSHFGMTILLLTLGLVSFHQKFIVSIIYVMMLSSFSLALLGVFFSEPYLGFIISRQVLTLFGAQVDPNNIAAFYLIGFGIALYLLSIDKKRSLLYLLIAIINAYCIIISGSRAGLVTIAVLLITIFLFNEGNQNLKSKFKILVVLLMLLMALFFILSKYVSVEVLERLFSFKSYSDASGRNDLWTSAIHYIFEKPLFGWGWGGNPVQGSHNTFISMILDIGLIGFSFFIFPILWIVWCSFYKKNYLSLIVLISSILPALFIDAINKRFFWNGLILAFVIINGYTDKKSVMN